MEDFFSLQGDCLGVSNWITIDQKMINDFANATLDHQWIHVDEERATKESPTHTTIAHGYLTLSLIPHLLGDVIDVQNLKQLVNFGINKLSFLRPITVNSKIRLKVQLLLTKNLGDNICQTTFMCNMEQDGLDEPVMECKIIYLYCF